ncbi:MAG: type III pantothenate kinase [Actinobacteria bacterium]|nr:type III pantothenate kinase [Actinomycetota bacterium]
MILCVDVGNSETTIGLFEDGSLKYVFRFETKLNETEDEVAADLNSLLLLVRLDFSCIKGICLSSVVPSVTRSFLNMASKYFRGIRVVNIEPGIRTGMPILYENPKEIGADRIANAVGCIERYGSPAIVVDFGTATTFDVISEKGEYLGGLIYPGIITSQRALFERAAKLSQVELKKPGRLIGRNTTESIQAGIVYGTAALVDELVRRIRDEMALNSKVIATGGLSFIVRNVSKEIEIFDPDLTLYGLLKIFQLNSQ